MHHFTVLLLPPLIPMSGLVTCRDIVAILLDSGASPLVHDATVKRTPLHAACERGRGGEEGKGRGIGGEGNRRSVRGWKGGGGGEGKGREMCLYFIFIEV